MRVGALVLAFAVGCGEPAPAAALLRDASAFAIEVEGSTGTGHVLWAAPAGDSLAIGYTYPAPEGERRGRLAGVLRDSVLTGHYATHGPGTHFRGPLRLTFHPDGSARGVWNDGEGTVVIRPAPGPTARR